MILSPRMNGHFTTNCRQLQEFSLHHPCNHITNYIICIFTKMYAISTVCIKYSWRMILTTWCPKKIVFRKVVIWVMLGSKNINVIIRCLALVPNVCRLVCTSLFLCTPLNGHLIRGFDIFLKTILFWDTL